MGTGLLALAVFAAGATGAFLAFRGSGPAPGPAATAVEFHALYPAVTAADAVSVQRLADEGGASWMADPNDVAQNFAKAVLGWRLSTVRFRDGQAVVTRLCQPHPVLCLRSTVTAELTMAQLGRTGAEGVWFVTTVSTIIVPGGGRAVSLSLRPGQSVAVDEALVAKVGLPDGTHVYTAFNYQLDGGRSYGEANGATVQSGEVRFRATNLVALSHPVDGIVYVAVPAGSDSSVSDPFLAPESRPALGGGGLAGPGGNVFTGFTAVPVRFVPADRAAPATPQPPPIASPAASSPYPRGAFESCPDVRDALSFGSDARTEAAATAVAFDLALQRPDTTTLARLTDPSVNDPLSINGTPASKAGPSATGGGAASKDSLVNYGCGSDVAKHTWFVVVNDGTNSASLDTTFYLTKRAEGWKVWGSY